MSTITKTFTVEGSKEAMVTFERFLCFLHYNAGHSGVFGMSFDGDGSDWLKFDPPPIKINSDHHLINTGPEVEIAYPNQYRAYSIDRNKHHYEAAKGELWKVHTNGERELRRTEPS